MAKSIQQRVAQTLTKAEREKKQKADRAHDARLNRAERRDIAAEAELDRRMEEGLELDAWDCL